MTSSSPIHCLARAVVLEDAHLLVCYNAKRPGYFYLPGGHIEEKESAEEALKREILEETGHALVPGAFLGVIENIFDAPNGCHCHEYNFFFGGHLKASPYPDAPLSLEPGSVGFKWLSLEALEQTILFPTPLKAKIFSWEQGGDFGSFSSIIPKPAG